jgi:hypothetical protein
MRRCLHDGVDAAHDVLVATCMRNRYTIAVYLILSRGLLEIDKRALAETGHKGLPGRDLSWDCCALACPVSSVMQATRMPVALCDDDMFKLFVLHRHHDTIVQRAALGLNRQHEILCATCTRSHGQAFDRVGYLGIHYEA